MATNEPRISWKIEEYNHREKSPDWFWALGVVAIASTAMAIIYHDIFFGIFIILSALILGFYAARKPDVIDIMISDEGVQIRNYLYPFEKLKGFAVNESTSGNHLIIESDRQMAPLISIALPGTIDPEGLRQLLATRLPEKPLKESISHQLMEHLGF